VAAPSGQTSCFATRKDTRRKTRHDICIVELKTCQDAADRPADGGATTTRELVERRSGLPA
jgi:hypothetical protein